MKVLTLLFIVLLAGCATNPIPKEKAVAVLSSHQFKFATKTNANTAVISIVRDSGHTGGICDSNIFLNKEWVGQVGAREFIQFYVPPGDYVIGAEARGICAGKLTEIKKSVKANDDLNLRVGYADDGGFVMKFEITEVSKP